MHSNNVKVLKSGLVNNSLALHEQLLSDGYTIEESKEIIKKAHIEFLETFTKDIKYKESANLLMTIKEFLLVKYKDKDTSENDKFKIKTFIEAFDNIVHML